MNRSFIKNFPRSLARFIASLPCLPSSEGNAEYPLGQASFSRCPYDTFLFRSAAGTNVMEDLWCLTGHRQALWWKDPASNASLRPTRGKSPPTPPDSHLRSEERSGGKEG